MPANLPYQTYDHVPVYRKNWFVILVIILCAPIIPFILWTGNAYYMKNGKLQAYSVTKRIFITLIIVIVCGMEFFLKHSQF